MSKDTNINSTCTKKRNRLTAKEVAIIAKCSESYVLKLRRGERDKNTELAISVIAIDEVIDGGVDTVLERIKNI